MKKLAAVVRNFQHQLQMDLVFFSVIWCKMGISEVSCIVMPVCMVITSELCLKCGAVCTVHSKPEQGMWWLCLYLHSAELCTEKWCIFEMYRCEYRMKFHIFLGKVYHICVNLQIRGLVTQPSL